MNIQRTQMTTNHFTPGRPGPVRLLVLHATGGVDPSDYDYLLHGGTPARPVSIHYQITPTGHITQLVADADQAWHAGKSTWLVDGKDIDYQTGCNACSVGIELSNDNSGHMPYPAVQYASALALVRQLVNRYHIPPTQLVRHLDIAPSRKTDPAGFPWLAFVAEVYQHAAAPPPAPLGPYRVRAGIDYAQVRQGRAVTAPEARINGDSVRYQPGTWLAIDDITNGWAHLLSGIGFVSLSLLERHIELDALTFLHPPRISKATFVRVLTEAHSPAVSLAAAMYDGILGVGVDPAIGLAFFQHESTYGKLGICKTYNTKNMGNTRRAFNPTRATAIQTSGGPFAQYRTWTLGAIDWAERIKVRYCDPTNADITFPVPLDTVEKATPIYAPVGDGNDPTAYARAVALAVRGWMASEATP